LEQDVHVLENVVFPLRARALAVLPMERTQRIVHDLERGCTAPTQVLFCDSLKALRSRHQQQQTSFKRKTLSPAVYRSGEKPALDEKSPTDVQTPPRLIGPATYYCFQSCLI